MRERRGIAERLEVRQAAEDVPPVLEPEQRRADVGAQLGEQGMVEQDAERRHDDDHEHDGREQAPHATQPELGEVDGAGLLEFGHEQAGDEIAGEDEEDGDAEQAAKRELEVEVIADDGDDGERAQAVERRDVALLHYFGCVFVAAPCRQCPSISRHAIYSARGVRCKGRWDIGRKTDERRPSEAHWVRQHP